MCITASVTCSGIYAYHILQVGEREEMWGSGTFYSYLCCEEWVSVLKAHKMPPKLVLIEHFNNTFVSSSSMIGKINVKLNQTDHSAVGLASCWPAKYLVMAIDVARCLIAYWRGLAFCNNTSRSTQNMSICHRCLSQVLVHQRTQNPRSAGRL